MQVTAAAANAVRIANWIATADKKEARDRKYYPEPILPPWITLDADNRQTEKFGDASMSIEEVNEWLGW